MNPRLRCLLLMVAAHIKTQTSQWLAGAGPRRYVQLVLALCLGAGCGGAPAPTERLTTAEASIRVAQELGASRQQRAARHLILAQEQSDRARRLMDDGENELADMMLRRARADAELAIALTKEAQTLEKARRAQVRFEQARAAAHPEP